MHKSYFCVFGLAEISAVSHAPNPSSLCCPSSLLSVIFVAPHGNFPYAIFPVRFFPTGPLFHSPHGSMVRAAVELSFPPPLSRITPKYAPLVLKSRLRLTSPFVISSPKSRLKYSYPVLLKHIADSA